jgi:hypothetical protein
VDKVGREIEKKREVGPTNRGGFGEVAAAKYCLDAENF